MSKKLEAREPTTDKAGQGDRPKGKRTDSAPKGSGRTPRKQSAPKALTAVTNALAAIETLEFRLFRRGRPSPLAPVRKSPQPPTTPRRDTGAERKDTYEIEIPEEGEVPAVRRLDETDTAPADSGRRPPWLFLLCVVLPVAATAAYLFFFAAPRYTSEAAYVVRKGGDAILASAFAISGMGRSDESSEVIKVYFESRDATEHLSQEVDLESLLSRAPSDILTVYPGIFYDETREGLYEAMRDAVSININDATGISTLSVTAYSPQDAQTIATVLLDEAESLVNRMNDRATSDTIAFAETVVAEDEARVRDIQTRMTKFRNDESILDPNAQSSSQIALMTGLSQELTEVDTEIAQLRASAPKNPRLKSLGEQRDAVARQVEKVRSELAGSTDSLAPKLSAYEDLALERELAIQALTTSYRSLEQARQEAFAERLYLQTISEPNLPDRASHPRVGMILLITLAFGIAAHQIARKLLGNTMDHTP